MTTMNTTIPTANPIIVEKRGFVDTKGPSNNGSIIDNNPATKNSKGRDTTNKICLRDNPDGGSLIVSTLGSLYVTKLFI